MPTRPLHECSYPGCHELVATSRCPKHPHERGKRGKSKSSTKKGYNYRWQRARLLFLAQHPWCEACKRKGFYRPAQVVDHIKPHRKDYELFWEETNWQSLCKPCHDEKTARGE